MRPTVPRVLVVARTALALPIAAAALVLAAGTASAADPPPAGSVPPDQDPFYSAPSDIGSYRPGQVVDDRKITPKTGDMADTTDAWQISYRTNDSHDHPELAVTTLLVPKKAWTGGGPRPVVSVQAAEDSTGTQCAPSYGISSGQGYGASSALFAASVLAKGWAVAMPDFEGPKSVFMGGPQAGHAVLDGIRAVKSLGTGGIGTSNPWALDGYSGGAQATGWAAELQPSYAPDVRLAGAALGGTPADPAAVARSLDGGAFSGFEAAGTVSLAAEYPEAGIDDLTTAQGKEALQQARGKCLTDLLTGFAFKRLADYTTVPDPLSVPSVAAMLKKNTMGAAAPATPIYDYHANTDEIVPVAQANVLTRAWCAKGATVQIVRDLIGEHAVEALVRGDDALSFLADRFAGRTPPDTCA
ncbi:lipase family protein [Actinoallomurus purpureus]|uniref:lipase family protein n=1 Tax=Actinoallomurus purpureus TaxID=478114 RepID=UPI0020936C8D|nr:lipase family protein [Actinoallomurus purpureus]MCO6009361.1 lipase family protein [Actinoallomurus purpureus]